LILLCTTHFHYTCDSFISPYTGVFILAVHGLSWCVTGTVKFKKDNLS